MYPTLIKLGSFEITTFGLMMFAAFIVGGWVLTRQFRRYGLTDDAASSIVMAAAIGGIAGAKIYYAILFRDWHLLLDRAGLVWYGGLIGGFLGCSAYLLIKRIDYFTAADAAAPALAIGYALGRIGCFLVGDDYGRPTNSWVGIAFPKGSPPTTAESLRQFGVHVDPSIPPDQVLRVHPDRRKCPANPAAVRVPPRPSFRSVVTAPSGPAGGDRPASRRRACPPGSRAGRRSIPSHGPRPGRWLRHRLPRAPAGRAD